jgi:ribulose-5-phosphate 4-epimerase/fuculose-1-phosphate aldolase
VHARRPDLRCVIHVHHRSVVAVASTVHGLLPCSLEACKLAPLVAERVHAFEGIASDPAECSRIQDELGDEASVLLMSNHGAIVGGATVRAGASPLCQ